MGDALQQEIELIPGRIDKRPGVECVGLFVLADGADRSGFEQPKRARPWNAPGTGHESLVQRHFTSFEMGLSAKRIDAKNGVSAFLTVFFGFVSFPLDTATCSLRVFLGGHNFSW